MKYFLSTFLCLCLLSCTLEKKEYFDFDKIEHYHINIDDTEIFELNDNPLKSKLDSLKNEIISSDAPQDISDLHFIDKLEEMGFKKSLVNTSKFTSIRTIFTEKSTLFNETSRCEPIYRDILIFKKQNKVIGTAKLCFDCMKSDIKGTTANTDNFGQDGDFEKLEVILKNE